LDADPLQDISNTSRIAVVIKQGHLYDSAALTRLRSWWQVIRSEQPARSAAPSRASRRAAYIASWPADRGSNHPALSQAEAGCSARNVRMRVTTCRTSSSTGTKRSV
jgi:hypothetical protein